ncbi:hypothetical protein XELAEV_18034046mg [Xenopus laevis]|uniref:Uncharacterized protein n=1 Tax=Xenopus laevis TaxID=8355 RepID=A0A974CLH6_XENLA|nr:hypothetical protein XELAEV_18034046mg [Xenopus laevis]
MHLLEGSCLAGVGAYRGPQQRQQHLCTQNNGKHPVPPGLSLMPPQRDVWCSLLFCNEPVPLPLTCSPHLPQKAVRSPLLCPTLAARLSLGSITWKASKLGASTWISSPSLCPDELELIVLLF